ncbi:MAG: N-acetylmuramoyl-L-alanine amidase [Thermoleophilia bacterium]|nr:N-acetylmuramoyl-L-alanine amidase [Thermoleophilia bacterium]
MFYHGKIRYWVGAAAAALSLSVAFLFSSGYGAVEPPPPETIGRNYVADAGRFADGQFRGTLLKGRGPGEAEAPVLGFSGETAALGLDASGPWAEGGYVSEPAEADFAFNAIGLHWVGQVPPGAGISAEVRFSRDGQIWDDWQDVEINDDDLPDHIDETRSGGETIGDLVFVDEARFFQYRLTLAANGLGESPAVTRLTASYIDSKGLNDSSSISLSGFINQAGRLFESGKAKAEPGVISRAQWGANESWMTWTPQYQAPKKIILHHTVTQNWDPDPPATVRSIYYYHAVSLGWGDIGYNYLVDWRGNVYEGRAGGAGAPFSQSVIAGHARGWNAGTIGISAMGNYQEMDITTATHNALVDLMTGKSNTYYIFPLGNDYMNGVYLPNYLGHRDVNATACPGHYLYQRLPAIRSAAAAQFRYKPEIANTRPAGDNQAANKRPLLYADIAGSGIAPSSTVVKLDGVDVSAGSTRRQNYASYRPPEPLDAGPHTVYMKVSNSWGESKEASWTFNVSQNSNNPRDYYWSWYDGINSRNWVLMANPVSSEDDSYFDLYIAGRYMDLTPFAVSDGLCPGLCGSVRAGKGKTIAPSYAGYMGGPVNAASLTGAKAITSQRVLWGKNSFDEVPGIDAGKLSSHYYWPWYDQLSSGYTNWVLVANQNNRSVFYEIAIAGQLVASGTIAAGGNATPTFPGVMGGPVEVKAWTDSGKGTPARVIASQRVLSNGGEAFNEQPGIPVEDLSERYLWTWYDQASAAATNWVLVANHNDFAIRYEIRIAGQVPPGGTGTLQPGGRVTPTFPGSMGGPVELRTYRVSDDSPAKSIASQRVIWGPSFEEVPGMPWGKLSHTYHWTWYDHSSAGASNWVLVSNPGGAPVYYEIAIAGQLRQSGTLGPGGNVTPVFPGTMSGPVQVQAWTDSGKGIPAGILASQRVVWNGHFNELTGTVLEGEGTAPTTAPAATVTANSDFHVNDGYGNLVVTLPAGQTASVDYDGGTYSLLTSTGFAHGGSSYYRMAPAAGGIMQVTSYNDVPTWNQSLNDNRFRGAIEVRYSPVSNRVWVVNDLPVESYLKGIAETSSGSPAELLKTMSVAARSYAIWHLDRGGKHGSSEIFHLKNSRFGNGDDQVYKGYGLEARFPDLVAAVNGTAGEVVTYGGQVAITPYFSRSDGRTRSAQEAGWGSSWPWLQSVPDPDCNGMTLLGHGVGLSGYGAYKRAERGDSYTTILGYYYTDTAVQPVNTQRNIRIAITSVAP